jgi:hypothetical protein
MPVEIKELVIRTVVDTGAMDRSVGRDSPAAAAESLADATNTEAIVQECVRQVMKILARNKER